MQNSLTVIKHLHFFFMRIVLLVTDEPVVVEGFRTLLAGSDYLLVDPIPFDVETLPGHVRKTEPDLVLVDCNRDTSLPLLARLCSATPQVPFLLLARNPSPELVYQAQDAGLSGVLDSRCTREQILAALGRCGAVDFAFDRPHGFELPASKTVRMTPREGQMVCLLAQGLKNKEIATVLGISEGTVKVYLSKLFRKVGAKDRFELALFGLKNMVGGSRTGGMAPAGSAASGLDPFAGLNTLVLSENVAKDDDYGSQAGAPAAFSGTGERCQLQHGSSRRPRLPLAVNSASRR